MPLVQLMRFLSTTALPLTTYLCASHDLCTAIMWMYDVRYISQRYSIQACYFAGSSDRVSDSSFASSNIYSFVTKFAVLLYRR